MTIDLPSFLSFEDVFVEDEVFWVELWLFGC
jgi:hypothetical protein